MVCGSGNDWGAVHIGKHPLWPVTLAKCEEGEEQEEDGESVDVEECCQAIVRNIHDLLQHHLDLHLCRDCLQGAVRGL